MCYLKLIILLNMNIFRRTSGLCGIVVFLLKLTGNARCNPPNRRRSDQWSQEFAQQDLDPPYVFDSIHYNESDVPADISLLPNRLVRTLPPSALTLRYMPNERICEDMFPPRDEKTEADSTINFDYVVLTDWYSKWHLNIGINVKDKAGAYKGILVQVRHKGVVAGSFEQAAGFSSIDCPPGKENTKYWGTIHDARFKFVTWKPPLNFDKDNIYTIHTTVIKEPGEVFRKTTTMPLWNSVPTFYNLSVEELKSQNVDDDSAPPSIQWSLVEQKANMYVTSKKRH